MHKLKTRLSECSEAQHTVNAAIIWLENVNCISLWKGQRKQTLFVKSIFLACCYQPKLHKHQKKKKKLSIFVAINPSVMSQEKEHQQFLWHEGLKTTPVHVAWEVLQEETSSCRSSWLKIGNFTRVNTRTTLKQSNLLGQHAVSCHSWLVSGFP